MNYLLISKSDPSPYTWKMELCSEDGTVLGMIPCSGFKFELPQPDGNPDVQVMVPHAFFRAQFRLEPDVVKFTEEKLQEVPAPC